MRRATPLRSGDLVRIEEAIGESRKGAETLAMIGVMRDALLKGSQTPDLRWLQLHPLPDGGARLELPQDGRSLLWAAPMSGADYWDFGWGRQSPGPDNSRYVGPAAMSWLRPLRGLPDELMFAVSASTVGGRIRAAAEAAGLEGFFGAASPLLGMQLDLAAAGLLWNMAGVRQLHLGAPPPMALCMMAGCPEPMPYDGSPFCGACREWALSDGQAATAAVASRSGFHAPGGRTENER